MQGVSGSQVPKWSLRQLHSFGSRLVLLFLLGNAQKAFRKYIATTMQLLALPQGFSSLKSHLVSLAEKVSTKPLAKTAS